VRVRHSQGDMRRDTHTETVIPHILRYIHIQGNTHTERERNIHTEREKKTHILREKETSTLREKKNTLRNTHTLCESKHTNTERDTHTHH